MQAEHSTEEEPHDTKSSTANVPDGGERPFSDPEENRVLFAALDSFRYVNWFEIPFGIYAYTYPLFITINIYAL